MDFYELSVDVSDDFSEILIAELAEVGFDSFTESDSGIQAYITQDTYSDTETKLVLEKYAEKTNLFYTLKSIKRENWNQQWEESFQPIEIDTKIYIRAHFHEAKPSFKHDIIITPKMSFGTGHHDTTAQVMSFQLEIDHQDKLVLDVGTGTGILAVLAEQLGAKEVVAFDIDEWSVENTNENIGLNNCQRISVNQGTIADQKKAKYNIILANINRNILLDEIPIYRTFMEDGGLLVLSGFYEKDIAEIEQKCVDVGLKKISQSSKNQWASVVFQS